jgi:hypothetical protein
MDSSIFSTFLWIAAAGALSMWVTRRRKRKLLDK